MNAGKSSGRHRNLVDRSHVPVTSTPGGPPQVACLIECETGRCLGTVVVSGMLARKTVKDWARIGFLTVTTSSESSE